MLLDYTPYIIIYVWLFSLCWVETATRNMAIRRALSNISALGLVIFIGCRWESGTDWISYKELFDYIEFDWSFILGIYHFDLGYVLLNALVKLFTNNYTIFLIIDAAIAVIILFTAVRKFSPYPNLSLFIFYTNYMLLQYIGSNRRMVALSLVPWIIYYIFLNKKRIALYCTGFAFLFHRSALFNAAAFLVPRRMFNASTVAIILLIALMFGASQLPTKLIGVLGGGVGGAMGASMNEYASNGADHMVYGTGSMIVSLLAALVKRGIFIAIYIIISSRYKIDSLTQFLFNIYILSVAVYITFVGSFFQMLSTYWAFIEIILLARFYRLISARSKVILLFFVGTFGVFQLNNALNIYPELYLPYKFFWDA